MTIETLAKWLEELVDVTEPACFETDREEEWWNAGRQDAFRCAATEVRAKLKKTQALADLVPGLVEDLKNSLDFAVASPGYHEGIKKVVAEARKVMEEPNEQADSDT